MNSVQKKRSIWVYTILPAIVVLVLAAIHGIDELFELHLNQYGLMPRVVSQWYGIFTFFFLHGDWEHLANNAMALFVLLSLLRYYFPVLFLRGLLLSIIAPAIVTFIIARENIHIGASGGIYFLVVFLFVSSVFRTNRYFLALSLLLVFLYGGLWWWVFPIETGVSYEGHLAGAITGFLSALYFKKAPFNPEVEEPKPRFELEEEEEKPDIIGDQWKTNYQIPVRYIYVDNEETKSSTDDPSANDGDESRVSPN